MLFIHQQIQSFLNLGACKEFPTMAKPRSPKKNIAVNPATAPEVSVPVSHNVSNPSVAADSATTPQFAAPETKKTETRPAARKPEIVRSDARATVVPINLEDEIRRLAYLYSERRGFTPGHETEDWLTAEHEVRQRYHQQSA
jgi:hypothetical protein